VELGGKSAHLIFEDADIEQAVGAAIQAFVINTGQFCMAGSRLLVARPVYDAVVQAVAAGAAHVPVGDPFDESTVIGPMVGERHVRKVEEYVRCACDDDRATVLTGGARLSLAGGCYFPPTVLAGVGNDARVVQEEIFGPVVTVQVFDTEEEAIRMANSTPFGLAAGFAHARRGVCAPGRPAPARGRRLGEHLGHARPGDPVRGLQAIGVRARERARGTA
jgi:phenylacetaldehyde dehydrogenase